MIQIRFTNIYVQVRKLIKKYSGKSLIELFPEKSILNFISGDADYIQSLFKD